MFLASINPRVGEQYKQYVLIRWAFRVRPRLPARTLRRAFDKLVERHDSLRLSIVPHGKEWRARILPRHPRGLQIENIAHLSKADQDAAILARANKPLDPLTEPLFEIVLLQGGDGGDVVLIRAHHAVIDGYSIGLVMEDLFRAMLNVPFVGMPPGHGDFIELTDRLLSDRAREKDAFWSAALLPVPRDPNIGRTAKGLPALSPEILRSSHQIEQLLTVPEAHALADRVKASGVSAFCHFHAAFCEAVCDISGQSEIIVASVLGRKDAALQRFVGADVQRIYVKYRSQSDGLSRAAARVSDQIAAASQHVPTDAVSPGSVTADAIKASGIPIARFRVHVLNPTRYQSGSVAQKLLNKGQDAGGLSLGFMSVEPLPLPKVLETGYELDLLVSQDDDLPNATLAADTEGYSPEELGDLASRIGARLGFSG